MVIIPFDEVKRSLEEKGIMNTGSFETLKNGGFERMFCENCGTQLEDGSKFCPNCGAPVNNSGEIKGFVYNENAVTDANQNLGYDQGANINQNSGYYTGSGAGQQVFVPLRTDRSLLVFVLLGLITCGIYCYVFMYYMIKDVNIACEGDGDETPGLLMFILLSLITCGIYSFVWYYKIGDRLARNCQRYGYTVTENGTTVLLWFFFGMWLCCVGPFIGWNILINHTNMVCAGYNREHGIVQ